MCSKVCKINNECVNTEIKGVDLEHDAPQAAKELRMWEGHRNLKGVCGERVGGNQH